MFKKYMPLLFILMGTFGIENMAKAADRCEDQSRSWCIGAQECASRLKYCIINGPQELTMYLAHQPPGQRDVSSNKTGINEYNRWMASMPGMVKKDACLSGCLALEAIKLCAGHCN